MTDVLSFPAAASAPECWTRTEILQQPDTLVATHALVARKAEAIAALVSSFLGLSEARVVLTGAGTSAFIGDSIAPSLTCLLGRPVEAVATTDIVSSPDLYLCPDVPLLLVSFGRSGNSPESIAAVQLADARLSEVRHLIITCNADGSLARREGDDALVIVLPEATHDRGFAMTSSFSAMMLAALIALHPPTLTAGRVSAIAEAVRQVADANEVALAKLAARRFTRVVYLGSGPFKGLAREAALKLLELSDGRLISSFDTSLGFRHGPKAIVDEDTLIVVFLSNHPLTRRYDLDIVEEIRADGHCGELVTISARPEDAPDVLVPGMASADDVDLLFPFLVPAQLFALHVSLELGLTPDTPNPSGTINRVVQGVRIHSVA